MSQQVILADQPKRHVVLSNASKRRVRIDLLAQRLGADDDVAAPAPGG